MGGSDGGGLSRWSRRKAAARHGAKDGRAEPQGAPEPTPAEAPDLPDPDTLGPDADFSAFMAREVPKELRQRALRRLWAGKPHLANLDGLVDYGGDFTDAATVPKVLNTIYEVGRGIRRLAPDEAEPEAEVAEPDTPEGGAADDMAGEPDVPAGVAPMDAAPVEATPPALDPFDEPVPVARPKAHRMRFARPDETETG